MEQWHWQGGRLVKGLRSLSISEAFDLIPADKDIAVACYRILKHWKTYNYVIEREIIKSINNETNHRINAIQILRRWLKNEKQKEQQVEIDIHKTC